MKRPLAIAHRGYSACYPENTLVGIRAAIDAGADIVEADARLSADGEVFCTHDADLQRIAGQPIRIAETEAARLGAVRLRDGEPLMTLASALEEAIARVPVLIDLKTADIALVSAVIRTVQKAGAADRVWIGAREKAQVTAALESQPKLRCLGFLPSLDQADAFMAAGAKAVRVWEGDLVEPGAARLFGRMPVWITTGGRNTGREPGDIDASQLAAVLQQGPDAILLNDPTLLAGQPS